MREWSREAKESPVCGLGCCEKGTSQRQSCRIVYCQYRYHIPRQGSWKARRTTPTSSSLEGGTVLSVWNCSSDFSPGKWSLRHRRICAVADSFDCIRLAGFDSYFRYIYIYGTKLL